MSVHGALNLASLGLSAEALAERRDGVGGSDANTLMSGNDERILKLWKEKRGLAEPEDLTDNLAVMMGSYTEPFNAAWFTKQTGLSVTHRGLVVACPVHDFMRCTIDGIVGDPKVSDIGGPRPLGVWEGKHCGVFDAEGDLFKRYVPQLTHNCLCAGKDRAWLSIFRGNADWLLFEYSLDQAYADRLIEIERSFWDCVIYGTPPVVIAEPVPVPLPAGVVEVDMATSNLWGHFAGEYIDTLLAADRHEEAREGLKELMPEEATRAFGAGVQIKRDKRGALRISIEKGS